MKLTLRAKFLEECLANELVPMGLGLKFMFSVGNDPEDLELKASVDRLLEERPKLSGGSSKKKEVNTKKTSPMIRCSMWIIQSS